MAEVRGEKPCVIQDEITLYASVSGVEGVSEGSRSSKYSLKKALWPRFVACGRESARESENSITRVILRPEDGMRKAVSCLVVVAAWSSRANATGSEEFLSYRETALSAYKAEYERIIAVRSGDPAIERFRKRLEAVERLNQEIIRSFLALESMDWSFSVPKDLPRRNVSTTLRHLPDEFSVSPRLLFW